ncbi:hypothetical protein J5069_02990 [Candidatus Symbiopectobacterium sp. NZEC127]|uniref:hypothetical protein n=1 Tax=Candidatus Symbiopectobacterium sp. NZEC127 TaxID=2820472 RepID=UPI00222612A6|nr:hypothetical protein [Candidatus Symbiopectobacterium sp. NZEC127]MCW2484857.1 hypothetical protein [Candidatus Symbiopectobacterium sp. NZEC127]
MKIIKYLVIVLIMSFSASASNQLSIDSFWESYQLKIMAEMNRKTLPKDYGAFISLKSSVDPKHRVISKFYMFRSSFPEIFNSTLDMKDILKNSLIPDYCNAENKAVLYEHKGMINIVAIDKNGGVHSLFFSKEICD